MNTAAPHHLPFFITPPGETDVLTAVTAIFLVLAVLGVGLLFFRLHTLPERVAHKSQKIQFEIVAILGLIALFTHMHIFWVAGLVLAFIDLPDFSTPLRRMARAVDKIAGVEPGEPLPEERAVAIPHGEPERKPPAAAMPEEWQQPAAAERKEPAHA